MSNPKTRIIYAATGLLLMTLGGWQAFGAEEATNAAASAQQKTEETTPTTVEDGGTGPYKAIEVGDKSLATHTIFRPKYLGVFGATNKLPILAWGNSGCANSPSGCQNFLSEIASHGFLVVAIGPVQTGGGRGGGMMGAGGGTKSSQLLDAINWAIAQDTNAGSIYCNKIDVAKIGVFGHSCGGLQALEVSPDPRITTTIVCDSGILNSSGGGTPGGGAGRGGGGGGGFGGAGGGMPGFGGGAGAGRGGAGGGGGMGGMPPLTKDFLTKLHAPVLYMLGGSTDIAYANGVDDYMRIDKIPAFMANMDVGHGGTYARPHGGEFAKVAIAWFQWQLKDDAEAGRMFTGDPCGLSKVTGWKVEKKNIF